MEYQLIKSRRKTIALQINREGALIVRAPLEMKIRDIDKFIHGNKEWIIANMEKQNRRIKYPVDEAAIKKLIQQAKEEIPDKISYYSQIMGVKPTSVKITRAKTRFGSCSAGNGICISCFLMLYPREAVDYVIVHELAHIVHKNHGREFYGLIARYLPDYKERKKLLKG